MRLSIQWARILGLFAVILAFSCFLNPKIYQTIMVDMINVPTTLMILGIFALLLGLAIIVNHPIFHGWPLMVTLLGYWITIKGIVLLFFPHWVHHLFELWKNKSMILAPLPALIIGVILLYFGFLHNVLKK